MVRKDDRHPTARPEAGDSGEDFLHRWSRRKQAWRHGAESYPGAETRITEQATGTDLQESHLPQRDLTDADMPPIETLDERSDYSVFMSPGVSDGLRSLALRKLFHQPAFNLTDGLNDYDGDYTAFAGLGDLVTHEMKRLLQCEVRSPKAPEPAAPQTAAAEGNSPVAPADPDDPGEQKT